MKLAFDQSGWEDFQWWADHDRATSKRVTKLIEAILREPGGWNWNARATQGIRSRGLVKANNPGTQNCLCDSRGSDHCSVQPQPLLDNFGADLPGDFLSNADVCNRVLGVVHLGLGSSL